LEIVLAAIIVGGIIAFIAYPLFTAPREEITEAPSELDGIVAQRDAAYDAIRDLDFDFQLGKLSQSDYVALREKYKGRAATALQQIDALGGNGAHIEEEVAQLRAAKHAAPPVDDIIEREVARLRADKSAPSSLNCPNCGTPYHAGDTFCVKCGRKLST
jgi:zinc-ribbon domain